MKIYSLYLFDLDGTLAERDSTELYPDAAQWLDNHGMAQWMVVTNQGGVGLRYWMETEGFGKPEEYPTEETILAHLEALFPDTLNRVLVAYAYQSKKSGKWSPTPNNDHMSWNRAWRKPAPGMLLYAMSRNGVEPYETLMIGDSEEDQQAAAAAGCDFVWAWQFFARDKPE
jgi:HAD superfamily hydrolase (TIGR01662 family)